jgi:hypothetical protein
MCGDDTKRLLNDTSYKILMNLIFGMSLLNLNNFIDIVWIKECKHIKFDKLF